MANTVYENKVLEAKATDLLTTKVNVRSMMTIDDDLKESPGMTKTINVYTYNGEAEEVAEGEGNTRRGTLSYEGRDYKVKVVQETFDYLDEDFMKDPTIVDNMMNGATQVMANKMTADFVAEVKKAEKTVEGKVGYDGIVDAIAELNVEDESKLFVLVANDWKAKLRKDPDYKSAKMGEIIYNGQIGTISGLPVIPSKALTKELYVMTKKAVKLFRKKDTEIEQDRDPDKRKNTVVLRDVYLCALENNDQIAKLTEAGAAAAAKA